MIRPLLLLFLFLLSGGAVTAQEGDLLQSPPAGEGTQGSQKGDSSASEPPEEDLLALTMEQDISTSDYYRLVEWVRSLGLETGGGVQDLRSRLLAHYKITPSGKKNEARQTISIETAYGTEYFSLEQVDEDYIRLYGGVSLTLRDNEKKTDHKISADEVLLNQKTNTMTARGRVVYRMTKEGADEVFQGHSLTFNLDDWKGIFYDGMSTRKRSVGGSSLDFYFAGDTIKRNQRDMVVLEEGVITSSVPESPYYRIQAQKIWIMAPGEWGLLNAMLYVGRVPVFYFPFFYQPGDEMFFNPVLGLPTSPDRRGTFLQTTTYLLGTKKKDSSPLSFLQIEEGTASGNKTEIRGLYLVKPEVPAPASPGNKDDVLKILLDIYSNLGLYAAWEGSLSNLGPVKKLTFLTAAAGSFTVFRTGQIYSPFSSGTFDSSKSLWEQWSYNKSNFFGQEIPFRYAAEVSVDTDLAKVTWEYYSDPFMTSDFRDRSENFSMFSLLGFGPKTTTVAEKSSLIWKGDWKVSLPSSPFSPWIKTLSLSGVSSSLDWARKTLTGKPAEDPGRSWFSPNRASLLSFNLSLSGDLLGGSGSESSPLAPPAAPGSSQEKSLTLLSPWGDKEASGDGGTGPGEQKEEKTLSSNGALGLIPPPLSGDINLGTSLQTAGGGNLSLTYSYSPRFNHQAYFNQEKWLTPVQMDWKTKYSQIFLNEDGRLGLRWGFGTLASLDQSLNYLRTTRLSYDFLDSLATEEKNSLLAGDAQNSIYKLNQSFRLTLNPLQSVDLLKSTQVTYNLSSKVWENKYLSYDTASGRGIYEEILPAWTKDGITAHEIAAGLSINPFPGSDLFSSSTNLRATLPPRVLERSLIQTLSSRYEWIRGSASTGLRYAESNDTWKKDPLRLTLDAEPWNLKLSNALEWDWELGEWTSFTSNLTWFNLTGRYSAARMAPYSFDSQNRNWVQGTVPSFVPRDAQISYRLSADRLRLWKNRIEVTGSLNSSLNFDLQRLTNTPFSLDLIWSVKIFEVLDFSFSSRSTNRAVFRYIPGLTDSLGLNLPTLNPLEDLVKSISFWNDDLRRDSNFNLSNINISLSHTMPDWTFTYKYSGFPQKNTALKKFEWVTNFSFSVIWKPIPEIKNETSVDAKNNFTVKVNS